MARHRCCADSMSLYAIATPAALEPGPLVTRCLKASASTGIPVKQWAIEKNPNAYVLLQRRNSTDPLWNKRVTVVKTDMRAWAGPIIDGQPGKALLAQQRAARLLIATATDAHSMSAGERAAMAHSYARQLGLID